MNEEETRLLKQGEEDTEPLIKSNVELEGKSESEKSADPLTTIFFGEEHDGSLAADKISFSLLALLYFAQSFPMGLFMGSIPLILTENKASYIDLGEMSIMGLPYVFKIFFAPLIDSLKPNNYGKRKTFIVPVQIISGIIMLIVSFWIEHLVENHRMHTLTFIGFLISTCCALQDVIVDGWAVSMVSKHNMALIPTTQKLFGSLANFISFNLFIPLNSVNFCNKYIWTTPHATPLIDMSGFLVAIGVFAIVTGIVVHFYKEKPIPEEHLSTFKEIVTSIKQFWYHPKLHIIFIFCLTSGFNVLPVLTIFTPAIIKKGFSREVITGIVTFLIPVRLLAILLAGFLNKKHKRELFIVTLCYLIDIIYIIAGVCILVYCDPSTEYTQTLVAIIILSLFTMVFMTLQSTSWQSFIFRITHESMATTFLVTVFSITNVGQYFPSMIALLVADYVDIWIIGGICIAYSAFYQIFLWKKLVPLEEFGPTNFGFYKEVNSPRSETA